MQCCLWLVHPVPCCVPACCVHPMTDELFIYKCFSHTHTTFHILVSFFLRGVPCYYLRWCCQRMNCYGGVCKRKEKTELWARKRSIQGALYVEISLLCQSCRDFELVWVTYVRAICFKRSLRCMVAAIVGIVWTR